MNNSLFSIGLMALPAFASLAVSASERYAPCAACHGERALGNKETGSPRLAGQNAQYLAEQLRNFRSSARGWHPDDTHG